MQTLSLDYASHDDALKAALSGKQPGEEVVLTIRAKVTANSDESIDLQTEELMVDEGPAEAEPEAETPEEEEDMDEESAPAMIVAISKKK